MPADRDTRTPEDFLADGADAAESIVFDGLTKAQATFNAR